MIKITSLIGYKHDSVKLVNRKLEYNEIQYIKKHKENIQYNVEDLVVIKITS